jgi:hypothetical protein
MAITARLSHKLHQTLGDEAAEDLVNWMQQVDAQRAEFGDLIKWSFVFWVGAVGAIAMLAGVLR